MDFFDFWAEAAGDARAHPRDQPILERVGRCGFTLECLPAPFRGPLRTAPVVLLYLAPGLSAFDREEANDPNSQARYVEERRGTTPYRGPDHHPPAWEWWSSRIAVFGDPQHLRTSIAQLNICPYHSEDFSDAPLLAALPSCRTALDWAQSVLFEEAVAGKRVVVCMRAARFWGLDKHAKYGDALYAPPVTVGGHMKKGIWREEIVGKVRSAIARTGALVA